MSWSSGYWFDLAEAEALVGEEPLPIPPGVCADCLVEPRKLYDVDGVPVCSRHAARREGLTFRAWEQRRETLAKRDRLNPAGKAARERDGA